ncbi:peptidoglycan-binding domain-containing protein [Roseovarius autotrophicus]|uniref:peptidoglycan-binding domain-containing protein n=1 Tax=Roseovarius autotrophicus TaxID=2824121 RepID=UPI0019FB58FF|nr:peptidoglycan-binding domain-containing protein [Roseovarius autotrophicus]MBE0452560.1 peptidoglycan-binding protein [Roseovarius sp.]
MVTKRFVIAALMTSVAALPGTQVAADLKDGIVGGLVGGAVSGIIVNESAKARERNRAPTTTTTTTPQQVYRAPTVSSQQVREEQTALNYFGFPAGTPDGVSGRNTRNAISQYQAHMGYPVNGYLAEHERQFLISSYYRAQSGGVATSQLIAERGQGTRGLLHAYRDEAAGGPQAQSPVMAAIPQGAQVQPSAGFAALPNFMASGGDGPSLASHCNQVSLVTSSNGGFVTAASMQDPRLALSEQFCLARTYAIAEGETMAASLKGITPAQLEEQCRAFGPAMRDHVAALSLQDRGEVIDGVRGFVLQTGQSPAQLAGTGKVCLSVGYRVDNMAVALGSGLLLTALGQEAYGELIGHHLNEGFGTTRRPDLAQGWYLAAIEAIENGATPVFAPGNDGRSELLRRAIPGGVAAPGGTVQPAAALPTFKLD